MMIWLKTKHEIKAKAAYQDARHIAQILKFFQDFLKHHCEILSIDPNKLTTWYLIGFDAVKLG